MKRIIFILSSALFIFSGMLALNAKPVHELFNTGAANGNSSLSFTEFKGAPVLPVAVVKETKEITTVCQVRYITKKNGITADLFTGVSKHEFISKSISGYKSYKEQSFCKIQLLPLFLSNRQFRI